MPDRPEAYPYEPYESNPSWPGLTTKTMPLCTGKNGTVGTDCKPWGYQASLNPKGRLV